MDKMYYIHSGILFSVNKEILTYATTWMNFEAIMLIEISQSQKDKYCRISLV